MKGITTLVDSVILSKVQASWDRLEVFQVKLGVAIECYYTSYGIILTDIWGTVVISNMQFEIRSCIKYWENIYTENIIRDFLKEYHIGNPEQDTLTTPHIRYFGNTCKQHRNNQQETCTAT